MTNLDQAIRQALSAEDAEFLARFEKEAPVHEQLFGTFRGAWGVLNVFGALLTFAIFGVFVYCVWNLFVTTDLRETVLWSVGALACATFIGMLKIWFWMEMQKNAILREVKRLELQVARLAARGRG
jgi:hypothetical protein